MPIPTPHPSYASFLHHSRLSEHSQTPFFPPLPSLYYRLLEVKYRDNGRYALDMLSTVITPILIKEVYTYPSENNRSKKIPLPRPLFDAIIKVARIRLKNTSETIAEFKEKLRHKFSSIKITKDKQVSTRLSYTRVFDKFFSFLRTYLIYTFLFQKKAANKPELNKTSSTDTSASILNKTASTDKMPSSNTSNRLVSGASAELAEADEPETQELELDPNHGASGMAFTVTQQTHSSSILLPAPAPQASNGVHMTFQDFLRSVEPKEKENHGCETHNKDEDYVLSSSESSEEEIY